MRLFILKAIPSDSSEAITEVNHTESNSTDSSEAVSEVNLTESNSFRQFRGYN